MNNVSLVGRLTKDPELRTIANGSVTTTVTVAINRTFANASGEREADFISVVVWNKQAENLAKYCFKGSQVGVTGRIQTRTYDAQDGTKRYVTEVVADNVSFLSSKGENSSYASNNENSNANNNENNNNAKVETTDISSDPFKDYGSELILNDDDLPF